MKKVSIAVCDDEKIARDIVRTAAVSLLLERETEADVEVYANALDLEERIKTKRFDLLLLDIKMPPVSGLAFARKLRQDNIATDIVFISNRLDKVFDTFEVRPFAFVRKTQLLEDMRAAMTQWINARADVSAPGDGRGRILLKQKSGMSMYETDKIVCFEGMKNKQLVHLQGRASNEVYSSLTAIEEMLTDRHFVRVQRGFLINLAHVKEIVTDRVVMSNAMTIPLRRGMTRRLRAVYMDYLQSYDIIMSRR